MLQFIFDVFLKKKKESQPTHVTGLKTLPPQDSTEKEMKPGSDSLLRACLNIPVLKP